MLVPAFPANESSRLQSLRALNILDTLPEERFDRYTRLAKRLFDVPIALVSLVDADRQWFKSCQGLGAAETPRDISFCGHAILESGPFVVSNALEDGRFLDNPLVAGAPHIRFYAGQPLVSEEGHALGTLCIIDREPRSLDEQDVAALVDLARMVEAEFEALHMATTDALTGISNRRGFLAIAEHLLAASNRLGHSASVVFVDLDRFKQINDVHGHDQGDQALVDVASVLVQTFRSSDVVGRLGGDEFAILCAHEGPIEPALQRFDEAITVHNQTAGRPYTLEYSTGVITVQAGESLDEVLKQADTAMYADKARRRVAPSR